MASSSAPRPSPSAHEHIETFSVEGPLPRAGQSDPADELSPSFRDRYNLLRVLGEGGFGVVYLAQDRVLKQRVAIKMLKIKGADERVLKRFIFEARTAANLRHSSIVNVFDMARTDDGVQQVMEYYPGGTLKDLLQEQGALPPRRALEISLKVLEGLAYAHAKGIVHRDIKPANIFFAEDGSVKIGDFGLCASFETHDHTITGEVMGTPLYVAPEQMEDAKDVDPRCDIYSLGVTLYHMVTGERPNVIDLSLVPQELKALITRSTARDREKRFSSCEEFRRMIQEVMPLVAGRPAEDLAADSGSIFALPNDSKSLVVGDFRPDSTAERTRETSNISSAAVTISAAVISSVVAVLLLLALAFGYYALIFSKQAAPATVATIPAGAFQSPPPGIRPDKARELADPNAMESEPSNGVAANGNANPSSEIGRRPTAGALADGSAVGAPDPFRPAGPMQNSFQDERAGQGLNGEVGEAPDGFAGAGNQQRPGQAGAPPPGQGRFAGSRPGPMLGMGQGPQAQGGSPLLPPGMQALSGTLHGYHRTGNGGLNQFLDSRNSLPLATILGLLGVWIEGQDYNQSEQALEQAMRMINQGKSIDVRNPVFPYLLGRIAEYKKDTVTARNSYSQAMQMYPAFFDKTPEAVQEMLDILGYEPDSVRMRAFLLKRPDPSLY